jgi:hypothetical protein
MIDDTPTMSIISFFGITDHFTPFKLIIIQLIDNRIDAVEGSKSRKENISKSHHHFFITLLKF